MTVDQIKLIKERLKVAQDRQKSYADPKHRNVKFNMGDKVFIKVSPWRGVLRFGKKGKLSPRYMGPYEVIECIGPLAYRIALPPELSQIHNVFHVSMLRKYISDPSHILQSDVVELKEDLSYPVQPVQILCKEEKQLRSKIIPLVKVLWRNQNMEEATWEREDDMRNKYPHLFQA